MYNDFLKKHFLLSVAVLLSHQAVIANYPPIKDVINSFAGVSSTYKPQPFYGDVRYIEIPSETDIPYRFFGIEKKAQTEQNFPELKQRILTTINAPSPRVLQLVGDSNWFGKQGLKTGRQLMAQRLPENHVIEFGYTSRKRDGNAVCINGLVNEYLDQYPEEASRVLANILGQTVVALGSWGAWASPHIRNFVVVYNEGQGTDAKPVYEKVNGEQIAGYTTFGDDVTMSDEMCDELICQEGGAQSFRQAVNVLIRNIPIQLIFNARQTKGENPKAQDLFSAARFLYMVRQTYNGDTPPARDVVQAIFDKYVTSFGTTYVEKVQQTLPNLFDYTKEDWETKMHQFKKATAAFFDHELYKRVGQLCHFIDAAAQ